MVHGILHTLGHDHEAGEEDLQAMEAQEQALLGALNWQVLSEQCPDATKIRFAVLATHFIRRARHDHFQTSKDHVGQILHL